MKIEESDKPEHKARYKLVRRDDFKDIPGLIIEADEDTGGARVQREEIVALTGERGWFAIVSRGR